MKVLISGTGFAGQGHADAFRMAGAEIVGIVGRTPHVVQEVAAQMNIPYAGTDWQEALEVCKPDIVSIATPGGAHYEAIKQAIAFGCHVFCDKPMTVTGETALELYQLAEGKGVKTAYAASFRYIPTVQHAKKLVAEGVIGEPWEVECISHFNLERDIPFGWSHRAEQGGGRLNNNFTHKLSIVTAIIGDKILNMAGDVRDDLGKAPIVEGVHNFKKRRDFIPKDLNDPSLEWGASNVEWTYTVMGQIESPMASKPVSVLFKHGGLQPKFHENYIAIYGSKGVIHMENHYGSGDLHLWDGAEWSVIPLPQEIADTVPEVKGETEQCWQYLVNDFVKDLRGETFDPYPTFKEGAQYQQLIDLIRQSDNWTDVTDLV